jgi:hypothetical protein
MKTSEQNTAYIWLGLKDPKKTDTALILPIQNWYYLQKKQEVIAPQVLTKKIVCMI